MVSQGVCAKGSVRPDLLYLSPDGAARRRKPTSLFALSGSFLLRFDAVQLTPLLSHSRPGSPGPSLLAAHRQTR